MRLLVLREHQELLLLVGHFLRLLNPFIRIPVVVLGNFDPISPSQRSIARLECRQLIEAVFVSQTGRWHAPGSARNKDDPRALQRFPLESHFSRHSIRRWPLRLRRTTRDQNNSTDRTGNAVKKHVRSLECGRKMDSEETNAMHMRKGLVAARRSTRYSDKRR